MVDLILSPVRACIKCGGCERYACGNCAPRSRLRLALKRSSACRPTLERFKESLQYDPLSGALTWRIRYKYSKVHVGSLAGNLSKVGKTKIYRELCLDGFKCYAHQVAWLLMTGAWPVALIDHRDGDGTNNAFLNLREATVAENQHNRKSAQSNSTTGLAGVSFRKDDSKKPFDARIKVNMRPIYLGSFETAELAYAAYLSAKRKLH